MPPPGIEPDSVAVYSRAASQMCRLGHPPGNRTPLAWVAARYLTSRTADVSGGGGNRTHRARRPTPLAGAFRLPIPDPTKAESGGVEPLGQCLPSRVSKPVPSHPGGTIHVKRCSSAAETYREQAPRVDSNHRTHHAEDGGIEPPRTGLQPVALPTELISDRCRRHHQVSYGSRKDLRTKLTGQDSNLYLRD